MSENSDEKIIEQETSTEETPLVDTVSDGPEPIIVETPEESEEKSESTDSTVEPAVQGDKSGKTPEQIEEDKKHFQSKFQETNEELKALKEKYSQPEETTENVPQPQPTTDTNLGNDRFASMSQEEIKNELREDPVLLAEVQRYQLKEEIGGMIRDIRKEERVSERFQAESDDADRFLRNFVQKNGLELSDLKQATEDIQARGIKGSPSAIASAVVDNLNLKLVLGHRGTEVEKAKAEAARAVKSQLRTTQPIGATDNLKDDDPGKKLANQIAPKTT